jgi:hypothetical protein
MLDRLAAEVGKHHVDAGCADIDTGDVAKLLVELQ